MADETIGELADRLPAGQWIDLPEYGVRVKKFGEPSSSITCPVCDMTSHNPNDVLHGYCGNCHQFTGQPRQPG